jgi:3-isopropylmalate/(R)-2-methylmalate dehydratase small subunit
MEPFGRLEAVAVPIDLPNVDTDRIIPARFLRHAPGPGYERYLFHDVRFDDEGRERPEFVLNQAPYRGARIVVAAENFACGSSREAAVWALAANGFRACVAPSFGDIFSENCAKNGLLAVVLTADVCAELRRQLRERPGATVVVDLPAQIITSPNGARHAFEVDGFRKECLLRGQDEIALTLSYEPAIAAYEARRAAGWPWRGGVASISPGR